MRKWYREIGAKSLASGRLARLSPEEHRAISRAGGLARAKALKARNEAGSMAGTDPAT